MGQIVNELNGFEIGKCYEHTTGYQLFVCGFVDSALYGKTLIAENSKGQFEPVGDREEHIVNFKEISKKKFLNDNFSKE